MTADRKRPLAPQEKLAANAATAARPHVPRADGIPVLAQDFSAGSLYALRAAVAAHATRAGMPESRACDIVLAAHELAVNAIRHGAGHGRLRITEHGGALHCQVTDDGQPAAAPAATRPETQATVPDDSPWPSQHGHGLWVVRRLADQLSVQSSPDGTIATASFTLPLPRQEPAQRTRSDSPTAPDQSRSR
jgi:anti-sigma regulatory factor (Ser/Thr protein kinase)